MRLREDIKSVVYMKTRSGELLAKVSESGRPTIITRNGKAKAVVLDVASYEGLRDAVMLLQWASQGEKDIQEGRVLPQEEALERVSSRVLAKRAGSAGFQPALSRQDGGVPSEEERT